MSTVILCRLFSGKIHAPKDNFLAVHDILLAMTDHFAHEAEAMAIKKQKDLMESSWTLSEKIWSRKLMNDIKKIFYFCVWK